jgi:uncharacterized protein YjbI with pentapeptide repeats
MKNIFDYAQYLFEAISPNFVIKGHVTGDVEKKEYLTTIDGKVYRGNITTVMPSGRTYDVKDFHGIKKYNADFSRADFSGVDMRNSLFKRCSFNMADMTGAMVEGSRFDECSFVGATGVDDMHGARFDGCTF